MFWVLIFSFCSNKNRPTFYCGLLWSQAKSLFKTAHKGNMMKTDLLSNDSSDFHYRLWAFSLKFLQYVSNSPNRFRYTTAGFLGCLKYQPAEIVHTCSSSGNSLTWTLSRTAKTKDVVLTETVDFRWGN